MADADLGAHRAEHGHARPGERFSHLGGSHVQHAEHLFAGQQRHGGAGYDGRDAGIRCG